MTLTDIKTRYSLTNQAVAERFGIPLRTVEDWSRGVRKPPSYVLTMMVQLLELGG